ncbi:PAS domain S-box protein [Vibrio albus]|uniref:PAS domain S-box protein n=1 Tax=Vibrio albus TaxID=2200953 RepID=A0A2U3B6X4_9VIBR|nr:GGDEF domain-containing phosphodiesterase [Vibrio albus]PWI32475.1 PAS domain S-box protein [Vibrio albus]
MKYSNDTKPPFKPRLQEVVRGDRELVPFLQSSFIRDCNISDMAVEEKYLLYFSIVKHSSNSVVITDDNMNIVYVNPKFEEMSGYTYHEVLGKTPKILSSNKTPEETYHDMHCTLQAKKQWKGEFVNIRCDGVEYIQEAVISPITNVKGEIVCYLGEKKDITAQKKAEKEVQQLTIFDSLTGLYNRAYFVEEVGRQTALPPVKKNHFSIIFIDLNRFKNINDTYGHLAGDKVLRIISKRLGKTISSDDFIARVGGDEFIITHRNATEESTSQLAKNIVASFHEPVMVNKQEHYLDASLGSAIWPEDGRTLTEILSRADLAMYNAKTLGHNYSPYSSDIGFKYTRELELSRKLHLAIENDRLSLAYQPKVDISTGQIDGMEALLRWDDAELGMISPVEFIPVAEKYKMMTLLGNWVVMAVCKQLNRWENEQKSFNGRVAINLSVQQIEHPRFYEQLLSILNSENISPYKIELEVTESMLVSDPDKIMVLFSRLKSVGFNISIDDFGTGYSSLSYLSKLRVDTLKIDKCFIEEITVDKHEQTIVKSIIELGHNLGLSVIAEGVETTEQLNYLSSLGCDTAQGYLFYKPQPGAKLFSGDHIHALAKV